MSDAVDKAEKIIAGEMTLPEGTDLKILIKNLKGELEYGLARKILEMARAVEAVKKDFVPYHWITQQFALCTYKDEELQPSIRFKNALVLLEELGLRKPETKDAETLAMGGAIYKRRWESEGRMEHLHQALELYSAAWERNPEQDMGYGGVNAAYILDVLAFQSRVNARRTSTDPFEANIFTAKAKMLREDMVRILPEFAGKKKAMKDGDITKEYWHVVTLAEIYFGLGDYNAAEQLLANARDMDAKEWERETTFRQLVNIVGLQGYIPPASKEPLLTGPWKALYAFFKEGGDLAFSCSRGRVGLALSGGGFRASFYHLGMLARLAEMDVLGSVETLSTVSGGSIVGAHYYLEIQHLLSTKPDSQITREDYCEIVKRVQIRFFEGVKKNLRMRTLSSLSHNLRMIFSSEYSRSHRIGELYEKELYSRVGLSDDRVDGPRTMPQLQIIPSEWERNTAFKPRYHNWRRRAKVPILLLNTTSLNSGHSWHFTARWMGEPPGLIGEEIDMNGRYRRFWYEQAPKPEHQNYRLGHAVAASACVPGLFEPLTLEGLYPGRTVRLVDGGVHDNQGVQGLLNEGCTLVLCSDASGQMQDQKRPSNNIIGVPLRSNSILQSRIREAEYQHLRARVESNSLRGLFFIHLKKDLDPMPIDWIDCQNPTVPPKISPCTTVYGIDKELQWKIAAIRTDLDSFTEFEAFSLMLSGYLMTEYEFKELDRRHKLDGGQGTWGNFDIHAPRSKWQFLELENILRQPPKSTDARRDDVEKQLDAASSQFLKIWQLDPTLKIISGLIGVAGLVGLGWFICAYWNEAICLPDISVSGITMFLLVAIVGALFPLFKWLRPKKAMRSRLWKAAIAVIGWIVSNIHLCIFDPLFLKRGKLERLLKLK